MLKHISLAEGSREDVLAELEQLGQDALRRGKEEKARGFAAAIGRIEDGDTLVQVRFTRYQIIE